MVVKERERGKELYEKKHNRSRCRVSTKEEILAQFLQDQNYTSCYEVISSISIQKSNYLLSKEI